MHPLTGHNRQCPARSSLSRQKNVSFACSVRKNEEMAFFEILIAGSGIECEIPPATDPIRGFYTTRRIWAVDQIIATKRAKRLVALEWIEDGAFASFSQGTTPLLEVEVVRTVSFLQGAFTRRPAGYTFFLND